MRQPLLPKTIEKKTEEDEFISCSYRNLIFGKKQDEKGGTKLWKVWKSNFDSSFSVGTLLLLGGLLYLQVPNTLTYQYSFSISIYAEPTPEDEKILIPLLPWGPNNQLQGFRESIYFAKTLGRSLAVPLFFPNWNQQGLPSTIDASMRLDIHSLSEYVHLIDPKDVSRICDGVATAVLKTRNDEDYPHKISALNFYDIEIAKNAKNFSMNNEIYKEGKFIDGIDKEKIKEYFSTDEKCAILDYWW